MKTMTKQPKSWVESMLVAYVDNQLEPAQMAAVEEIIRDDPEARTIVAVLQRSAAAVKAAFDQPLREAVPARLLATVGADDGSSAVGGNVVSLVARKLRLGRPTITALAASLAALAIGFGAGHWQAAPGGGIRVAGGPDGTESGQYEAALYQALEDSNPGTQVAYVETAAGRHGAVTIVGPVAANVGGNCLEFLREWSDASNKVMSRGLACRSDTGEWSVLTMPPKPAS
jgi:anti-sigma factor RsiW